MDTAPDRGITEVAADDTDQSLLELGRYLHESGYHYIAVTPATHAHFVRHADNRPARNLRDIFGWSRPFERSLVTDRVFELMHNAGVLTQVGDLWRSTVRWSSLDGQLCVHSAYPTQARDAVFFGPDTYRFVRLISTYLQTSNRSMMSAVDIGCGSGAGALLIARACPQARVLAVDINPEALRLTRINARLAGTSNVESAYSNLLEDVPGKFDLIVSNPPYMLDPHERAYRHGGGELGAEVSLRIVDSALSRLVPGGTLLLYTGIAIVDGHDSFLQALHQRLDSMPFTWHYEEIDPDVFGEELTKPAYAQVERIAVVSLALTHVEG